MATVTYNPAFTTSNAIISKLSEMQQSFSAMHEHAKAALEVCVKCGEEVFTEETSAKIDEAVKEKSLYGLAATTTVGKSGDSLDIRISKKVAEFVKLQEDCKTLRIKPNLLFYGCKPMGSKRNTD